MVDVLLGLQWGDEGKGKIVDYLAPEYDLIARFQGGPNAGHTIYHNNTKLVLHTLPSGVLNTNCMNLIGNGVVIDPITLQQEIDTLLPIAGNEMLNRLYVAEKAHLILPTHRLLDAASETAKGKEKIGSTLKGIGPAYMDKTGRNGLRLGDILSADFDTQYRQLTQKHLQILKQLYDFEPDLAEKEAIFFEAVNSLKKLQIVAGEYWVNKQLSLGKRVLAEGAQGIMLDIDFGTYPYVTSSNTITAGVCTGLGVAPQKIKDVYGITKAYCTRVGSGPFPTELHDEAGNMLRKTGNEYGATTGRERRCGNIDLVALKYAIMLSGTTKLIMTKADVLGQQPTIEACTHYNINGKITDEFPYNSSVEQ
ncbi:MAG: adenylosuccinate synthase, partial [Chitinophagia bacterium]|nr:adenylosuccinate synthase [Chitinophagia bacterium]